MQTSYGKWMDLLENGPRHLVFQPRSTNLLIRRLNLFWEHLLRNLGLKGRYTQERRDQMDQTLEPDFLYPEEKKLVHHLIAEQNEASAWDDTEKGTFKEDFFPPVEMAVKEHVPWVLKNIPIPPGMYDEVCRIIKTKLDADTYEPSNLSYRSRWFCVIKKDKKSLRIVHSLEPLNTVTITSQLMTFYIIKNCKKPLLMSTKATIISKM